MTEDRKASYEVAIPTRGTNTAGVLAGLIPHAPFPLRLVAGQPIVEAHSVELLKILQHLGCKVTIELQTGEGIGRIREQVLCQTSYDVVISIDDDVVVTPPGTFPKLADAATEFDFAVPVVRLVQHFQEEFHGHKELWETIAPDDPRIQEALKKLGPDWLRVYDINRDVFTSYLNGSCFAVRKEKAAMLCGELTDWVLGGEDVYIGKKVGGRGICRNNTFAYHFGYFSEDKLKFNYIAQKIQYNEPELFRKYAEKD